MSESFIGKPDHGIKVPACDTAIFAGDYLSWPTFRDMFTAIYKNNSRLTDVEKLNHLIQKTVGEAKEIVQRVPLTSSRLLGKVSQHNTIISEFL